jgi:dTMP kinase
MTKTIDELREIPFKYMVTFEGTDCSFKETNAKQLVDYIQNELGYKAKLFSFPNYDSKSSYLLTNYFKNTSRVKPLSAINISMLYASDFYDTWYNQIKKYYDNGYIIVMDRWIYSNIYYQGIRSLQELRSDLSVENLRYYLESHRLKEFIRDYEHIVYDEMELPDTNIMLKMIHDKKTTKELIQERNSDNDINEGEFTYLELVNELFKHLFINKSYCVKEIRLDKTDKEFRTQEEIFNEVRLEFETNFRYHLDRWRMDNEVNR